MAQQDPCWIHLQSLLESSVLFFMLRTSSANTVSVSAAKLKMCACCPTGVTVVLQEKLQLGFQ